MTRQNNNNSNSSNPTIPATRPPRTTIRPTRASLARETMIQAKQQQQQQPNGTVRTSLPQDIKKSSLPSPSSSSTVADSKRPRSRTSLSATTSTASPRPSKRPNISRSQRTTAAAAAAAATTTTTTTTAGHKRKSLITTKESLKKRPAWDMRGKVSDMEAQLKETQNRLSGLYKFKDELEILKEDKESDRKKAIQRLVTIKAEMQNVKRDHEQDMENLDAQQRIHYQELLDQQLIYKRQEPTMEIELEDAKRKLEQAQTRSDQAMQQQQQLEGKLLQLTMDTKSKEEEIHRVELKLQRYGGTLADREREIIRLKKALDNKLPALEAAEIKLQESGAANERLQTMIDELEKV